MASLRLSSPFLRIPPSWTATCSRSIATSHTLVPPQASSSTSSADTAANPGLNDAISSHTGASHSSESSSSPPKLPYYITRTEKNGALPVYSDIRSGGTRQTIQIRHVTGNLEALKEDVKKRYPHLKQITVNPRTSSIIIKGLDPSVPQIKTWLESKGL